MNKDQQNLPREDALMRLRTTAETSGSTVPARYEGRLRNFVADGKRVLDTTRRASQSYLRKITDRRTGARRVAKSPPKPLAGAGGGVVYSFLICVAVPSLIALMYYSIWASDVYVTETKITVREGDDGGMVPSAVASGASSILSKFGLNGARSTVQDSMIVLDYLKSRSVVIDIGGRDAMARYYDQENVDWISRLDSSEEFESLWFYWKKRVTASVDTLSNIVTIRVRAYTPQDALSLSRKIITRSEILVNEISRRSREDALKRAKSEVEKSMADLAEVRSRLLAFQQRSRSIDPMESAKQITRLISELSLQKIEIESRLETSDNTGVSGRPGERYLRTQLDVINSQIAELEKKLTGRSVAASVSEQLKEFEVLKLRQEFSEQIYTLARSSFEEARRKLDTQLLYLVVVVPPLLPEHALYPRVFIDTGLIFLSTCVLWAIGALLVATVRDSR